MPPKSKDIGLHIVVKLTDLRKGSFSSKKKAYRLTYPLKLADLERTRIPPKSMLTFFQEDWPISKGAHSSTSARLPCSVKIVYFNRTQVPPKSKAIGLIFTLRFASFKVVNSLPNSEGIGHLSCKINSFEMGAFLP